MYERHALKILQQSGENKTDSAPDIWGKRKEVKKKIRRPQHNNINHKSTQKSTIKVNQPLIQQIKEGVEGKKENKSTTSRPRLNKTRS